MTRPLTAALLIFAFDAVFFGGLWMVNPALCLEAVAVCVICVLVWVAVEGMRQGMPDAPLPITVPSAHMWAELDVLRDRDNFAEVEAWREDGAA